MKTQTKRPEPCECGCGRKTTRVLLMIRRQDADTAEALGWAATSIDPMRERVRLIRGHTAEDYLASEEEGS